MNIKTVILITFIFTLPVLITSCNFTKLSTNTREGDRNAFDRAYVIIHNYNESKFYRILVSELKRELDFNLIDADILTLDELSLKTEADVSNLVANFNPQVVIEFKEVRKLTSNLFIPDVYTPIEVNDGRVCMIEVRDYQTNEILWKGKLVTDEFWEKKRAARKSVRKIIESFESSKLISIR
jgi:hypothetical protein